MKVRNGYILGILNASLTNNLLKRSKEEKIGENCLKIFTVFTAVNALLVGRKAFKRCRNRMRISYTSHFTNAKICHSNVP